MSILREWITCIVGPNGSGKSTLINLLSGMLPLDGGLVIIDNVGLRVVKAHETPDHGITRTFQEVRLFDQITVWDNIMVVLTDRRLFPSLLERTKPRHKEEARRILQSVGLWEKARRYGPGPVIRPAKATRDRPCDGDGRGYLPVRRAISPVSFPGCLSK